MFNEEEIIQIDSLINKKLESIQNDIKTLSRHCLKTQIFHLMDYGFDNNNLNFDVNRYFTFSSNLVPEIIDAILSNHFIILEFRDIYWFLNSFQKDDFNKRYNISFINIYPDHTVKDEKENIQSIIQFCILEYNKNLEKNTILKSSNKIRINNEILTKNTIYENSI